jgi:hypothetical protein
MPLAQPKKNYLIRLDENKILNQFITRTFEGLDLGFANTYILQVPSRPNHP